MMKKLILALAVIVFATSAARADYVIRDGNGVLRTVAAGESCGSNVICTETALIDGSGLFVGTGANPFAITFGTGVKLPDFATTPTFNLGNINGAPPSASNPLWIQPGTGAVFHVVCDSGCSGGGGGGGTSSLFGAAFPTSGTAIGLSDGTNMLALRGDATNGAWVNVKASVALPVTGTFWQAIQPVSGTVAATQSGAWAITANAGTNLNTSLLALESGGNLAAAAAGVGTTNTNLGSPGSTACATDNGSCNLNALLQRNNQRLTSAITALGSPFQAGGSIGNTSFGISGTLPAFAATPTFNLGTLNGAATAAAQATGNTSLSSIDGKTPALGQALASASVPVVLPSTQITALTPPTTVTANLGTIAGVATAANQTSGAQKTQIVDGSGNVIASTSNNLNVQCANCSGSGVSTGDEASFTAGTSLFAGTGGFYQTTATANPLANGQQGMWQMTANRAGFVNLRNAAGAEVGVAAAPLQVSLANTAANAAAVKVDGSAVTQPVSGTVAANATLSAETTKVIGTVRNLGGTGATLDFAGQNASSPANAWLIGAQYNATPTTVATGNASPLQIDSSGNLKVNIAAGASSGAVAQGSTTAGQTGGLTQAAVTTAAPTYTTATTNPLSMDTSGNLRVTVTGAVGLAQGSTTSGQTGSMIMGAVTTAAPSYTTAQTSPVSLTPAGDLRTVFSNASIAATQSGAWNVTNISGTVSLPTGAATAAKQPALGTAGAASADVLTVQGIASMTPLLVNPGTAANWGVVTQGSTTSGQSGQLGLAAVTTAAPSYTTAQSSALNMTTAGGLRIDNASVAGTTILTGNGTTAAGSQRVTVASDSAARAVGGEGPTGSAVPSGARLTGVQSGANMVAMLQASASAPINVSTATTTQIVALSGSTKIYVTSFDVIAGGTGNITFVYGTGTNCGTGQTALTGAYNLTAQAGIAKGSGIGPVLVVPAGNALCVLTSAAVQMSGSVSYTQF